VWEAASGKEVGQPLRHRGRVHSATFSPNGKSVVTASADKTARVWEVLIGSEEDSGLLADIAEVVSG
jgi:WD40 repeat protein